MKNIVVFASGSGSNFQSIIDATLSGEFPAKITGLITDRDTIKAIERATLHDIPYRVIKHPSLNNTAQFERALLEALNDFEADFIVLAGYLKKIPSKVIKKYEDRILNIHPSLLPKFGGKGFYGKKVHQSVIDHQEKESGCTVHLVNEIYDDGRILGQSKLELTSHETVESLAQKVLTLEHKLYPKVISDYIKTFEK